MAESQERRRATRIALVGRPRAQAWGTVEVWLVDLSATGARITLGEQLPNGSHCTLHLPPPLGSLTLPARVVWSGIFGAEQTAEGERHVIYQSGMAFVDLTADQQATLGGILEQLASGEAQRRERAP